MKNYLLDTNIVIYYMKGLFDLQNKFDKISSDVIFISEITLAELKFGIAKSEKPEKNQIILDNFLTGVQILPIFNSLDFYASEKAKLQKNGTPIDDFDLLIAATAVVNNFVMVTNNTNHFNRVSKIVLEDWTK